MDPGFSVDEVAYPIFASSANSVKLIACQDRADSHPYG